MKLEEPPRGSDLNETGCPWKEWFRDYRRNPILHREKTQKARKSFFRRVGTIRAEVGDKDLYAAIDIAVDKLEAQIRKNKHKMNRSLQDRMGIKEAFKSDELDLKALERELLSPVKKKRIKLDILSQDEAITQMELLGHDFFIYRNEDKEVSVLYLREDGKYGLIETE